MKILLVRPGLGVLGRRKYSSRACMEPLALAILAGLTPKGVEVTACDDRFEEIPYDGDFSLVALSVGTFQARRAYEIGDEFRRRGVKVVMGGFHITFCPDEAKEHADAIALGEAEGLWPQIVEDAQKGQLKERYKHQEPPRLGGVLPDRSIFADKSYIPMSVIQFGRGCHHNCDFCCIKAFYKTGCRHRPSEDVIAEIEDAGRSWVFFTDDNLVVDKERAKEFLKALIPLRLHWTSQVSLDFVDDDELLALMVKSGCQCVVIGLESLDEKNMKQMGKGWSKAGAYEEKLAKIRAHGLMVYATFVFGYGNDTEEVFQRTLGFAMEQKFFLVNFNHLQPYPGTRLYKRLKKEGRLIYDRWWLEESYRFGDACFQPEKMSAQELTDGAFKARASFYSWRGILSRMWDFSANFKSFYNGSTFLTCNIISRQDILRKQGLMLGLGRTKEDKRLIEEPSA